MCDGRNVMFAQSVLGELTYESEAADRLRAEVRAERSSARDLRDQLSQAKVLFLLLLSLLPICSLYKLPLPSGWQCPGNLRSSGCS